jgi:hypothetical protein
MVSEMTPGKHPDSGLGQVATIHLDIVARSVNARGGDKDVPHGSTKKRFRPVYRA